MRLQPRELTGYDGSTVSTHRADCSCPSPVAGVCHDQRIGAFEPQQKSFCQPLKLTDNRLPFPNSVSVVETAAMDSMACNREQSRKGRADLAAAGSLHPAALAQPWYDGRSVPLELAVARHRGRHAAADGLPTALPVDLLDPGLFEPLLVGGKGTQALGL